ncbi:hypothetical protein XF14_30495 [Burkholderia gladioli]|nr:hypothetical protein XF14_30495 [Burkholderia gladioli]
MAELAVAAVGLPCWRRRRFVCPVCLSLRGRGRPSPLPCPRVVPPIAPCPRPMLPRMPASLAPSVLPMPGARSRSCRSSRSRRRRPPPVHRARACRPPRRPASARWFPTSSTIRSR